MIKKTGFLVFGVLVSISVSAKTTLYGNANAFAQVTNDNGSALQINGYLSEFGFRGEQAINESTGVNFNASFGFNLVDSWSVFAREGAIGVDGAYGSIQIFHGSTPLARTNQQLTLMHQDPDALSLAFNYQASDALSVPVGLNSVDGVRYAPPPVSETLSLNIALIPGEVSGAETGLSLTGSFKQDSLSLSAGFDVNTEYENAQLLRLTGHLTLKEIDLGLMLQAGRNSQLQTWARSVLGFAYLPLPISAFETRLKVMTAFNQVTNVADETTSQLYFSLVDEIPLNDKTSLYGFAEIELANEFEDVSSYLGLGMTMAF